MRLFFIISFVCFIASFSKAENQADSTLLEADSLFNAKKFTESFKVYEHLLTTEKKASAAMLLKMAYIKEGLGDYSMALYYLNLYYLQTSDKKVLSKMEELADKKDLKGYNYADFEFFETVFFKYFNPIIYTLLAISILLFAIAIRYKKKSEYSPVIPVILNILVLALLFYTLNFGREYHKGIVVQSNTYLMEGPSAGAEVIAIIGKGHRLPVYKNHDVWTQTEWQGKKAFIKTNKIKKVNFM
ncbi:tetratricopeptide repeat protein [Fulvivirga sediminis]|uniref:SH3 domain-containing protein n=1 Tax=Fulvivirga sediminis TaxID=2803949 RepID=A0A937F5V1_9BACT|nr:hypothetical protein [Fulvivirga sediminis]MBL3656315.1 hypothetical protein [Fulvivirga sediminis]